MNIATILTGSRDHDLNIKLAWTKPLERMGYKVFIVGRTEQPNVISMYSEPYKEYPQHLQSDMEQWLGLSYKYISSLDCKNFAKREGTDIRKPEDINQYFTFLTIWYQDFYIKNKIDVVTLALESVPWNLVGYYVALKMNIPAVIMTSSRFPRIGVMFGKNYYSDIWDWNERGKGTDWEEIWELYKEKGYLKYPDAGLASFWSLKNMQINLSKALQYLQTKKDMANINPYEKTALPPLTTEIRRAMWATIRGTINNIFWQQPRDEEFFFYPFHFEGDANITVAEPFTNQIDLAKSIARSLPVGVKLYVKPHPAYMGIDIHFSDLINLSKIPNIRVLHPAVSPIKLIKNAIGIITINSSTGFEAMIHNKPVITLGHDFYCHDDLVYLVRSWGELPSIISKVYRERKPKSSQETVRSFVKTIYKNTVFTQGDISYAEDPLTQEDGEKVAFALDKIYKKL